MKVLNESLLEEILSTENLRSAWYAVKSNKGCSGIDGIEVEEFIEHIRPHWETVHEKLLKGSYKPAPVKRIYIPKGNGKSRPLGIPTVQDRMIQQAINQILQHHFEPLFSDNSYGFRPGRSAHDAVKATRAYIAEGKRWVVDIDLASFFDEVNHDILMRQVSEVIRDKRVLHLIGKYLRAGVLEEGRLTKSYKGVPQGSPLSPLLANVYLHTLDKELEKRKLSFCRYADDCNIYVSSEKAAQRVYESVCAWIEKHLKIHINQEKSAWGEPWERQFLGYQHKQDGDMDPSPKAIEKYKDTVRTIFNDRNSLSEETVKSRWGLYIRGWSQYFSLSKGGRWRRSISGWTRRHIRKWYWQRWHNAQGRRNNLRTLGEKEHNLRRAPLWGSAWKMSKHPIMQSALSNKVLLNYGFLTPINFVT